VPFLQPDLLARIRTIAGAPNLSPYFESSVPGLHFVGLAAASNFGPAMRFVFGANFSARRLARHLAARYASCHA
jgi:hypothetical protein